MCVCVCDRPTCNVAGDALHSGRLIQGQSGALALHPRSVDEDAGISCQARKGQADVLIQVVHLPHCLRILQLRR